MLQYIVNIPKFIFDKYLFIINWTKQWHICHYLAWATFPVLGYLLYMYTVDLIWYSGHFDAYAMLFLVVMFYLTLAIIYALIVFVFPVTIFVYFIFYLCKKNFKIKNKILLFNPIYSIFYNIMMLYILLVLICYYFKIIS